jgi:prolycopene isomerase
VGAGPYPWPDAPLAGAQGLYCVGDSTFPGQGVNAVVFSGFGCAHRVLTDLGRAPALPGLDAGYNALLGAVRDRV